MIDWLKVGGRRVCPLSEWSLKSVLVSFYKFARLKTQVIVMLTFIKIEGRLYDLIMEIWYTQPYPIDRVWRFMVFFISARASAPLLPIGFPSRLQKLDSAATMTHQYFPHRRGTHRALGLKPSPPIFLTLIYNSHNWYPLIYLHLAYLSFYAFWHLYNAYAVQRSTCSHDNNEHGHEERVCGLGTRL